MPLVQFLSGASASPLRLVTVFDLFADARITSVSATTMTANLGSLSFTLTGTGLQFGTGAGSHTLTGGVVDGLKVAKSGVVEIETVSLGLVARQFQNAITLETTGSDVTAMEDLILAKGWVYYNNFKPIRLLENAVSRDGVVLNFAGDDQYATSGASNLFMGDGNDSVSGGGFSDDRFYGGRGRDFMYGGGGNDKLFGGVGNDTLHGSFGDDSLYGGKGADIFVFGDGDGADTIGNFNLARDKIDLAPGETVSFAAGLGGELVVLHGDMGASIQLVNIAFADSGLVVLI